jgi:starch synthase
MGMSAADILSTVSPTYAREILTPEFGSGLQDFLQLRAGTLYGILNGLDDKMWDPETDPAIAQNYNLDTLSRRAANKTALRKEVNLDGKADMPLLVLIGRMDRQKGVDLALEALRQISDLPWQCVLLGTGDAVLQAAAQKLEVDMPGRMRSVLRFDAKFSRRMYAGGDMLIMPSRYEPCGLAQMIAMRYGCVPVARATGGLVDSISDLDDPAESTGFLFKEASAEALAVSLRRALAAYADPAAWQARQMCGMQQDFRWQRSAQAYAQIYAKMIA